MATQQHTKDNGEWGNGVVFSGAALGLMLLAGLYYVNVNHLADPAWDRLSASPSTSVTAGNGAMAGASPGALASFESRWNAAVLPFRVEPSL